MTTMRQTAEPTPAGMGFSMPAEWERHEATWLGWPHHPTDWPGKLDTIRWVYGEIVRKIATGEEVRILVDSAAEERLARRRLATAGADLRRVRFVRHPTNRGWTRDSGPVFVKRRTGRHTGTAIVHFHFNAWAKYHDFGKDRRVPETAARLFGKRLFHARVGRRDFVLEGGGIVGDDTHGHVDDICRFVSPTSRPAPRGRLAARGHTTAHA